MRPSPLSYWRAPWTVTPAAVLGEERHCSATKEVEESGNKFLSFLPVVILTYFYRFSQVVIGIFFLKWCSSESRRRRQRNNKENKQHTARILWVVLKGEMEAPRMLAVPSSIPWSNPLLCCWRPEDDESTSGLRNLKVRSGPSTTIESLTKSFLKEKLVERLAPIVPCNWAVVVCETK